jgi:DNA-binding transcriptional ArsR family regulator
MRGAPEKTVREVSLLLGLPSTAQLLLLVLAREGREFSIHHLRKKTGRSERALRHHLKRLAGMGLIRRRVGRTERKRKACFYSFDVREFVGGVRRVLEERRERLERILGEHLGP